MDCSRDGAVRKDADGKPIPVLKYPGTSIDVRVMLWVEL
jgi:hypothetical protein